MVQSQTLAVTLFQNARYPQGLNANTAWLGIYRVLMWYEPVNLANVVALPHIIDSKNLRPPPGHAIPRTTLNIWARRAQAMEQYLAGLNDITNECPAYKGAAMWTRSNIEYIVVTNEFGSARLQRLLRDNCVDTVVHVHKPAVVNVCQIDGALDSLADLTDLIARSHTW